MKGLLLKDFLTLKTYFRTVILLIVIYAVIGIGNGNLSFVYFISIFLSTFLVMNTFSFDDYSGWDIYALSLPVTRKNIVKSKYILAVILLLLGTAISIFLTIISICLGTSKIDFAFLELLMSIAIALFLLSILLPVIYKIGNEKARLWLTIFLAASFFGILALAKGILGSVEPSFANTIVKILPWFIPIFLIFLYYGSYRLSCYFYQKKNF